MRTYNHSGCPTCLLQLAYTALFLHPSKVCFIHSLLNCIALALCNSFARYLSSAASSTGSPGIGLNTPSPIFTIQSPYLRMLIYQSSVSSVCLVPGDWDHPQNQISPSALVTVLPSALLSPPGSTPGSNEMAYDITVTYP